ncbi:MAG: hypothetical protein JO015_04930 [Verrucomicrobia bacterium]|nr:hypothetical protein [Verrucomicrobiota bacterium]
MTTLPEASPVKSLAEELETVRLLWRQCIETYASGVEATLDQVQASVRGQQRARKLPVSKLGDLRDMLAMCRGLNLRPEKGRRKDLKKIETLIEELRLLTEQW